MSATTSNPIPASLLIHASSAVEADFGVESSADETAMVVRSALRWCGSTSSVREFPGAQPVSLDRRHISESWLLREEYWATEKSDGTRYLVVAMGGRVYVMNRRFSVRRTGIVLPGRDSPHSPHEGTVLDAELVQMHNGKMVLLIYDALVVQGRLRTGESLDRRLAAVQNHVMAPRAVTDSHPGSDVEGCIVELKPFRPLDQLERMVHETIPRLPYRNDGVVFTPVGRPYTAGTDDRVLKWKPPDMNTVDFALQVRWIAGHRWFMLCSAMRQMTMDRYWIGLDGEQAAYFTAAGGPHIVECSFDSALHSEAPDDRTGLLASRQAGGWRIVGLRLDKTTPNDESILERILTSIRDAVTADDVLGEARRYTERKAFLQAARRGELVEPQSGPPPNGGRLPAGERSRPPVGPHTGGDASVPHWGGDLPEHPAGDAVAAAARRRDGMAGKHVPDMHIVEPVAVGGRVAGGAAGCGAGAPSAARPVVLPARKRTLAEQLASGEDS